MDTVDGKKLSDFKLWRCKHNKDHVLGVSERVRVNLQMGGRGVKYYSNRLRLFRKAVDLNAEIPDEIEVCGIVDGRTLSMSWVCSMCQCVHEWHPDREFMEHLAGTYLAE